jgi:DNA-binding response OmpR family regulator
MHQPQKTRPRLVISLNEPGRSAEACQCFQNWGWEVHPAHTGPEARTLALRLQADLVLLDTELAEESGWLTCAKLVHERPTTRVVLLGDNDPRSSVYAEFVGATRFFPFAHWEKVQEMMPAPVRQAG